MDSEVIEKLEQGKYISAIKILRSKNAIGLKEAKHQIDHYLQQNPYLKLPQVKRPISPMLVLAILFLAYVLYRIFFLSQ